MDRFVWDEAKYPTMSPLKEIVDNIHGFVAKVEDDLKVLLKHLLVALVYSFISCKMSHLAYSICYELVLYLQQASTGLHVLQPFKCDFIDF